MERSGLLAASSNPEQLFNPSGSEKRPNRLLAHESQTPIIRHSAESLLNRFTRYGDIADKRHVEFKIHGMRHFLEATPVSDDHGLEWLIVVVVPKSDFMAQIEATHRIIIVFLLSFLTIALAARIVAAQWISRPIARLNAAAQAIAAGKLHHTLQDKSRILEISELTDYRTKDFSSVHFEDYIKMTRSW